MSIITIVFSFKLCNTDVTLNWSITHLTHFSILSEDRANYEGIHHFISEEEEKINNKNSGQTSFKMAFNRPFSE